MNAPTNNELVEHNVRMALGDLLLQNVVLKAKIAELEAQLNDRPEPSEPLPKANGRDKVTEAHR